MLLLLSLETQELPWQESCSLRLGFLRLDTSRATWQVSLFFADVVFVLFFVVLTYLDILNYTALFNKVDASARPATISAIAETMGTVIFAS